MLSATLIFYFFSLNSMISFWEGVFLFSGLLGFNVYLFRNIGRDYAENTKLVDGDPKQVNQYGWLASMSLLLGGIIGLYFGSELLVENAILISSKFGISERIIGVTIVAIGTSLPELITSIIAAMSKRTDLALGNILGSNIMNVLSIIGITAIINPIQVSEAFLESDFLWMLGITFLLFPLMRTKMRISKVEGSILLLSYFTYLYFLL